jgi:(4-(4-[2-(gamma-L-glutamylamino)ethyl]phenoxymethyl)furan-2-yl)methanamine synthase
MTWLGLDIGGANLKVADGHGWARVLPFELWRNPTGLFAALLELLRSAPEAAGLAITMTGELCDCFRTKADGVRQILDAIEHIANAREVRVYLVDGRLVLISQAHEMPHLAAASNWHALAQYACRFSVGRAGVLIDVGSTTSDIVPFVDGRPSPIGDNDTARLVAGELVYTGVGRTPVCAITDAIPWQETLCPVAAEFFASTADAYVILGQLPEREDFTGTADGRPLTKQFAKERLGRMICADSSIFNLSDAELVAAHVGRAQCVQLQCALQKVITKMACPPEYVLLSGAGEFLGRAVADNVLAAAPIVSLGEKLGPAASIAGPAHALAVLANEAEAASQGRLDSGQQILICSMFTSL